jgi:predicted lysophospholipase L1 biosynthesis ABC-type transport system permease subunit
MGRLQPGTTIDKASAQLAAQSPGIMAATEITGYDSQTVKQYLAFRLNAYPAEAGVSNLRKDYSSSLWLLLGITGLVLLIACANLANLMLARANTREREISLRLALGAGRRRIIRQLLTESVLLVVTGSALGLAIAELLSRVMVASLSTSDDSRIILPMRIDWRVLLFTGAAAAITCLIFGLIPALRASGANPIDAMKSGGRGMTASRQRFSLQRLMVFIQVSDCWRAAVREEFCEPGISKPRNARGWCYDRVRQVSVIAHCSRPDL